MEPDTINLCDLASPCSRYKLKKNTSHVIYGRTQCKRKDWYKKESVLMKISKTQKPAKLLRVLKEKKKKEQRPAGFEPTTFPFLNDSSTTEQQPTPNQRSDGNWGWDASSFQTAQLKPLSVKKSVKKTLNCSIKSSKNKNELRQRNRVVLAHRAEVVCQEVSRT